MGGVHRGGLPAGSVPPPGAPPSGAILPDALAEPSMEAGQHPGTTGPQGWECPRCHRVYAPWVTCCGTCGPQAADVRTEITEGGFETTSQAMRRAGIKPEDVL